MPDLSSSLNRPSLPLADRKVGHDAIGCGSQVSIKNHLSGAVQIDARNFVDR
jgi:hypothetical protein